MPAGHNSHWAQIFVNDACWAQFTLGTDIPGRSYNGLPDLAVQMTGRSHKPKSTRESCSSMRGANFHHVGELFTIEQKSNSRQT
ncbi:hypothetical protein RRG08_037358 [Elysia crispata]|uniref:Uncharacterized protein n=1 Tax=Elysia crispata TaxID=231223 RepID=A0AAE1AAF5_9GAST|nr:hypothetical protein RRG08_037358 [Elysia crispata]